MAAAMGGWRSGKSFIWANWMHDRMEQYPTLRHYAAGGDLPQLKRGFLRTFMDLMDRLRIKYDYFKSEGVIVLRHNGAKLESLSAEVRDRILSSEIDTVILEEPQTWDDGEAIYQLLVGRLSGSPESRAFRPAFQPQLRMSFNPTEVGSWLYKLLEEQKAMPYWKFSVRRNFLMPDYAGYIKLQEANLPPSLWPFHLDGEWITVGGNVYQGFDLNIHGSRSVEYGEAHPFLPTAAEIRDALDETPEWGEFDQNPLCWGLDFNIGHQASVVGQAYEQLTEQTGWTSVPGLPAEPIEIAVTPDWQKRILAVFDEIFLENATIAAVVAEFIKRWGHIAKRTGVFIYGDSTGGNRSQQTAWSNYEVIGQALIDAEIPFTMFIPDNPSEIDRVNTVLGQLLTGTGPGFLMDPEKCPELMADLLGVKRKEGKNQIDKRRDLRRTHISDALGYWVFVDRRTHMGETLKFLSVMDR